MNLFIAIILEGYFNTISKSQQLIEPQLIIQFKTAWSQFDPDATGVIDTAKFMEFLYELGPPLGWKESYRLKPKS